MDHSQQNNRNAIINKHKDSQSSSNSYDCLTSDDREDETVNWEIDCNIQKEEKDFIEGHQCRGVKIRRATKQIRRGDRR